MTTDQFAQGWIKLTLMTSQVYRLQRLARVCPKSENAKLDRIQSLQNRTRQEIKLLDKKLHQHIKYT